MVSRIATGFQNENTLRNLRQSNEGLALSTYQITTGQRARRLADISEDASQILNLREVTSRTQSYLDNITSAKNQLQAMENALQGMSDLLGDAASTATLGRTENSASTRATLAPKAQAIAEGFYSLFTTQFNGEYLFSGSNGTVSPVSGNAAATAYPGAPLATTWYQGDTTTPAIITGPSTTLNYGVAGNEAAFSKIKAGVEALWYGLQNNALSDIDNAVNVLKEAKTDLSSLLGRVGGQMNTMDQITQRHTAQQGFLQEQSDELEKIDISEAITKFSEQQATMEASMSIIVRVNQLSLLDFL